MTPAARTTWNFSTAGRLTFGPGAVDQLPVLLAPLKINRTLLITDRVLAAAG